MHIAKPSRLHALIALAFALGSTGCSSLLGIGDAQTRPSCPYKEGVACQPMESVYRSVVAETAGPSADDPFRNRAAAATAAAGIAAPAITAQASTATAASPLTVVPANVGAAPAARPLAPSQLRSGPRVLGLWIKPYADVDGDLADASRVYVQIDNGQWLIEHVRERARTQFAPPARPPVSSATPSAPAPSAARTSGLPDAAALRNAASQAAASGSSAVDEIARRVGEMFPSNTPR